MNGQGDGERMRGRRHSAYQIQELENFFENNTRPTKEQRSELGQRLNLETKQVKYWFQNKRNQVKNTRERLENRALIEDRDNLLAAQEQLRCAMIHHSSCRNCGRATNCGDVDYELQKLITENARLKAELEPYSSFLSDPIQVQVTPSEPLPYSPSIPRGNPAPQPDLGCGTTTSAKMEESKFLDIAKKAMKELIALGELDCPFWTIDLRSKELSLIYETYRGAFNHIVKPPGCVVESSRDIGLVQMTSSSLVETIMDTSKWTDAFASLVPVASRKKLIRTCDGGSKSGSLQQIKAEFRIISPLVPKRQVTFLRYCEALRDGLWVVVDVTPAKYPTFLPYGAATRLPSGLIIEDMANGYSKVTWIEQAEYNENHIHQLYQPLVGSGIGLGAGRWLATLQRYCESFSTLSSTNLGEISPGLSAKGATELVKLAQRMTLSYYTGITGSTVGKWKIIQVQNVAQDMMFMTRKNLNEPGEHTGIVLSAATSVWFPVNQQTLFAFLSHPSCRHEWDILTHNTTMEETIRIQKAKSHGNIISLLRVIRNGMLVMQEVWNDASGAVVVYAPVETSSIESVRRGENSDSVQLLPSGFSILPDGVIDHKGESSTGGGCLLTLGLQILVSSNPTAELSQGTVKTVEELMVHTIGKIKSALHIQT